MNELNGVNLVAQLMAVSAITAPKSQGVNYVQVKIIGGEDLNKIGEAMKAYGQKSGKGHFDRDGENIANSDALVLIGLKNAAPCGLDCGACGFTRCQDLIQKEPVEVEFKAKGPYVLIVLSIWVSPSVPPSKPPACIMWTVESCTGWAWRFAIWVWWTGTWCWAFLSR